MEKKEEKKKGKKNSISLKITDVPNFELHHIIYYMDNLAVSLSDVINIILLLGKYHSHCAKFKNLKPSFAGFMNDLKLLLLFVFFMALKKVKSVEIACKISSDISINSLF